MAEAHVSAVWAFDAGRFGLRVVLRKRRCPCGVRPPWVVHDRYAWLWRSVAVEPAPGRAFFLLLPRLPWEWVQLFLVAFAAEEGAARVRLVRDGSGSHATVPDAPRPSRFSACSAPS